MTETIHEHITSVRATLDELEAALQAVDTARARYHEVAGGLAVRLGAPRLPELLQLPAPAAEAITAATETKAAIAETKPAIGETPPPGRVVRRARRATSAAAKPKGRPRPVREPRATATAPAPGTETCERHSRRSRCRGPVKLIVKCTVPGCNWSCSRCAAHPAKSAAHILGAHVHWAHARTKRTPPARVARKASERTDEKRRPVPATAAAAPTRRDLIAQRARAVAAPAATPKPAVTRKCGRSQARRCSNCGEPGHRAPGCPRPAGNPDGAGRETTGVQDFEDVGDLVVGHDVAPRTPSVGVEE